MARVLNFSAGPSQLPLAVLERAAKEMTDYGNTGTSVMEMSHRSKAFEGGGGGRQPESIFPTGVGGILYPPKCFYKDVLYEKLFTELAPYADDIWFWAMAVLNPEYCGKSPYVVVENNCSVLNKLADIEPRQMQCEKPLYRYNLKRKGNDKQFETIINAYPQIVEYLRSIRF